MNIEITSSLKQPAAEGDLVDPVFIYFGNALFKFFPVFLFFLASSCQTKIQYEAPTKTQERASDKICWIYGNWWEVFDDPLLNSLVEESLSQNPSLKIARGRLRLARFQARQSQSFLFPTMTFNTDSAKYLQSKTGIFAPPPPPAKSFFPLNYTQTELYVDLEYEFDLFEKNKNQWRAALGEAEAVRIEEMIARLILSLSLTESYFKLQIDLLREQIAKAYLDNRQDVLDLTNKTIKNHLGTDILKNNAENNLLVASQESLARGLDIEIDRHLLQSLLGNDEEIDVRQMETTLENIAAKSAPLLKNFLLEIPLDLVGFRADIQVSLNRLRSLGFQVKAAEALFYPNINLTALTGQQTLTLSKLFNGESLFGIWGPALHLPIFDGGYLRSNLNIRKTEYEIASHKYQETLLIAIRQVLDAKANLETVSGQLQQAREIKSKTEQIKMLIEEKLKRNLASNFDLYEANANFLNALYQEAALQLSELQALLNLIRTVGGGYQT